MNKVSIKGYLYVIASAVIFGSMPLMARLIYAEGANPMTLVFLRNALALPVLAVMAYRQDRTLSIPVRMLPGISLIAVMGCCATPFLLFSSYSYIASGTATVFHFIYPAVVVMGGILFMRAKVLVGNLISVGVCMVGISLFYTTGEVLDPRGSALALFSGITFAIYVLILAGYERGNVSGIRFSFYTVAVSSVVMFVVCLVTGQLDFPETLKGWGLCLLFAMAVTAGAVVLFQQGTFLIGGQHASILSTLEPITSIVIGAVAFQEVIILRTMVGSGLVILASILIAVFEMRHTQNSEETV